MKEDAVSVAPEERVAIVSVREADCGERRDGYAGDARGRVDIAARSRWMLVTTSDLICRADRGAGASKAAQKALPGSPRQQRAFLESFR